MDNLAQSVFNLGCNINRTKAQEYKYADAKRWARKQCEDTGIQHLVYWNPLEKKTHVVRFDTVTPESWELIEND